MHHEGRLNEEVQVRGFAELRSEERVLGTIKDLFKRGNCQEGDSYANQEIATNGAV